MAIKMNVADVAVIGGGASGLTAAVSCLRTAEEQKKRIRVMLFEAAPSVGKKLLVTGNGRCNLSNGDICADKYFGGRELFESVYSRFDNVCTLGFFESMGVLTVTDSEGRIYPRSLRAESVVNALFAECVRLGVETFTDTKIVSIKKNSDDFLLNGVFRVKAVIVAVGGLASQNKLNGSSMIDILKGSGVRFSELKPSLTAVTVKSFPKVLKGVRAAGNVRLYLDGELAAEETGVVQYTDYGLSGIAVMQLTAFLARAKSTSEAFVVIDSAPDMSFGELKEHFIKIRKRVPDISALLFLSGIIPEKLGKSILDGAGIPPERPLAEIGKKQSDDMLRLCKARSFRVGGVRGFDHAQVTSGGIIPEELTPSLELKKLRGVYVCGEIADVDGLCGGYNLQWAWSSGYVAGRNCVMENF